MDPAASGPPRPTPTPLHTPGGTTHPSATQHLSRHASAITLEPLSGARRGTGTPPNPPHYPAGCPHGPLRAHSPGHGPLPAGYIAPARSGGLLPHTQAPATRSPSPGTTPTQAGAGLTRSRPPSDHAQRDNDLPLQPPLSMASPGGRGLWVTSSHQPSCPGGRLCRIPGLAEMHNGGGSLLVQIAMLLFCAILTWRLHLLAF